ncbi:MAG: PDZ domain-containing protein [Chitinophagaceae bacterium]|nr:MAG: PDZ domain-containing protein [Chitinophagaceae bacterium]
MKRYFLSAATLAILTLSVPGAVSAQDGEKKTKTNLSDYEEIIIRKKKDGDARVTVEIKDGEVKVDGKSLDDFESDAISVRRRKPDQIVYGRPASPFRSGTVTVNGMPMNNANRAFLGVSSEESKDGVRIAQVTENSGAAKAGLKSGDIIVKIDDAKISEPGDVTTAVRKHKPEDKIVITYKRDGKEVKTTATLGKYEGMAVAGFGAMPELYAPSLDRLQDLQNFRFETDAPRLRMVSARPRIGIRAQDTEESNGAKVLEVTDESVAAKAGIKKDDVITSFDGKPVKSADDLSSASRDAREKSTIEVKLNRGGKAQTLEIKIPKKLKTTTL